MRNNIYARKLLTVFLSIVVFWIAFSYIASGDEAEKPRLTIHCISPISTGALFFDPKFYKSSVNTNWARIAIHQTGKTPLKNTRLTVDFGNWADKTVENLR
jgi:hypothetical protein